MALFSRPPPPQGAPPPSYTFVNKMYSRSLRPVVISSTFLAGLWALLWGISSFRDISIDKNHATRLEVFDIVLGSLYMATFTIELFGLVSAYLQRLVMIRLYAFLVLGAALIVTAADLIRVIVHFAFKDELINECTALATGDTIETRFGIWGPTSTTTLSPQDAAQFCNSAWSNDSASEVIWFLVAGVLSFLFAALAFAYYRQMLDPASPANTQRKPRGGGGPEHYSPPYMPELPYQGGGAGAYAPPLGPPPAAQSSVYVPAYDSAKLPDYAERVSDGKGDRKGEEDVKDDPFADFEHRNPV